MVAILALMLLPQSAVWAQDGADKTVEETTKSGFASGLAYLLTIVVVALGVTVVCRAARREDETESLIRDHDEPNFGQY